jgi:hypothetical protein
MARVIVRILDSPPQTPVGPLELILAEARRLNGRRHVTGFHAAGAADVAIVAEGPDGTTFGERLQRLIREAADADSGLVVLGSGSIPAATVADRRTFVEAASGAGPADPRTALANNRYSADVIAIASPGELPVIPHLPNDNAVPRWLDEVAGWNVSDLRSRWLLQLDLDSPLDVELIRPGRLPAAEAGLLRARRTAIGGLMADSRAELLVAGRTSAGTLRWLETNAACRVRALIEERGLRASSRLAQGDGAGTLEARARPPRSILGALLDRDGPEAFGERLAEVADGALVDTRVLLAHRLGVDEHTWPQAEDRFASDLLLADRIDDPWLRALTASAAEAPIPVLLGGHTLVGPGVRLLAADPW